MDYWYIAYLIILFVFGFTLSTEDIKASDFRFWILLVCIVGAHICGRARGV